MEEALIGFRNLSNSLGSLLNQIFIKTTRNLYLTSLQTLSFPKPIATHVIIYIIIYPGEKGREAMGERNDFLKRGRKMCSWVGGEVVRVLEEMKEGNP